VKLLVKGNEKLTLAAAVAVLSILALSISFSPTFNLLVNAQGENQTSSAMAQEVQQKLTALAEKVRELGTGAGVNLSLPQGGNLTDQLRTLMESPSFSNLTQQLPQELSKLGLNGTNIKDLQEESGASLAGLVQKLQNLTSSRGT
jgi:hypothetical protein